MGIRFDLGVEEVLGMRCCHCCISVFDEKVVAISTTFIWLPYLRQRFFTTVFGGRGDGRVKDFILGH